MIAEIITCCEFITQALWLRHFVKGLKIVDFIVRPIKIFCNNSTTCFFNVSRRRYKYIDIKYLSMRENIKRHEVSIEFLSAELMIEDPMTKSLPVIQFKIHVEHMGLIDSILYLVSL